MPPIKKNIEKDYVFELFREYRESKANPNCNYVTAYVKNFSLITGRKEQPHKMKIFQSPDTAMPKNQQQQHIIELPVKQLAKPELCSVKTAVLHQYIISKPQN